MEDGVYAVRITLPYAQVHPIVEAWNPHVHQIIAYEHDASRVHTHLLLLGCRVSTARLKQLANREEKGNTFWNFKTITEAPFDKYITYMSKGHIDPSYNSSEVHYDDKDLQRLKGLWVDPPKPAPRTLTARERYQDFEGLIQKMPPDQRSDRTWIKLHARNYLFAHHGWMNQQYRNEMVSYVETYAFKYHLIV